MQYKYYTLRVRHLDCWSNYTSHNYSDFLIDSQTGIGILKARRMVVSFGDDIKSSIKYTMSKDKSIIDYTVDNILNDNKLKIVLVDMLQRGDNTILSKLKSFDIMLVNSKIYNGIEEYQFITSQEVGFKIINDLNMPSKIVLENVISQKINSNTILKAISRDTADILLTERQKRIINRAKELGYFDVPKKIDLDELAEEFGITKMAVSILLRNIIKKLLNLI